ncbi:histone-lysine N-methyltransferase SETMAR [Gigaspora margarita]|uniref:Histone-lysine N-methyltransferase SETMAR n=1 Tax=Gigaspora margarita TaxID=4874 RepID=A0A8H4AL27_GIGMA|nr:histone-lysine N-methyltransferase SETMAR [Gigaspora margarita]
MKLTSNAFIIEDISNGLEPFPVSLIYNDDKELEELRIHRKYTVHCVELSSEKEIVTNEESPSYYDGCDCTDNCISEDCGCKSAHGYFYTTQQSHQRGLNLNFFVPTSIYECNSSCTCSPIICPNRIVQHGIKIPLQVFKTMDGRGWGLRTLRKIFKGMFVCEYAGEIIRTEEAKRRWEEMKSDAMAQNYVLCLREHVENRILRTNIDPINIGNAGRYINHSCAPSLQIYLVRINSLIPVAAFFAVRDIDAGEELTFDYSGFDDHGGRLENVAMVDDIEGKKGKKKCLCGNEICRGILPFDQSL